MNKNSKNHQGVVDSKVGNYKMYKVNKHWVFASAVMLSMLGAGMMHTESSAHADTVNEAQTEMVHKVTESKETQSATTTPAKEATPATSATSKVATPTKEAQSTAQNDSGTKTAENAAPSSAASSVAPTKSASSAADKATTSAATKPEQKKTATTDNVSKAVSNKNDSTNNTAKNDQKDSKTSSAASSAAIKPSADATAQDNVSTAAKPADKSSDSNSEASVKEGIDNNKIETSGLDAKDSKNDINDDAIAKAKADATAQVNDKNGVDNKKVDKNKTAESRDLRAGGSALEDGHLEIDGSAIEGLIDNGDGTYSGDLKFIYTGSALVAQLGEPSNTVIEIPEQLRDLFSRISATGNWSKYLSGNLTFIFDYIFTQTHTYTNEDISYDGSNLIFKNPSVTDLGTKNTRVVINFDIGQAVTDFNVDIAAASNNYLFNAALVEPTNAIDWHVIGDYAGQASLKTNHLMPHTEVLEAPYVEQPVYDNSTTITGKAESQAEIIITLENGDVVTGHANYDGTYSVNIPAQKAGGQIKVQQRVDGKTSDATVVTVQEAPEVIDKPTIDAPHAGSKTITGTGVVGDSIQIYAPSSDGSYVLIGNTMVGVNGKWEAAVWDQFTLIEGEKIYAVQSKGNATSDKAYTTVLPEIVVDAPGINPITEGDQVITGTGIAGAEVVVSFDSGNSQTEIGHAIVKGDGTWSVDASHVILNSGDLISATQTYEDVTSDKTTVSVKDKAVVEAPTINDVTEGDQFITGTGKAGDTITVYFEDNDIQIGQSVVVDENGNWKVDCSDYNLHGGKRIYAIQSKDGVNSDRTYATINSRVAAPTINDVTEGDRFITGKGEAGDTITVYFADNGVQIGQSVVVDQYGNWSVDCSDYTLRAGRRIYAIQSKNGADSEPVYATIKGEVVVPTINDVTTGDTAITGTGEPGDTITVYYEDNDVQIGQPVVVDDNGNWSIDCSDYNLRPGRTIYAVQSKDGMKSDPVYTTIKDKENVTAPKINDVTEGDKYITGTGTAGDTITVYLEDGDTQIGQPVVVGDDGTWSVAVGRTVIYAGDRIYAIQSKDGVESEPTYTTVKAKETVTAPKISDVTEGDKYITGTGKAGDTITVYLEDGDTQIGQPIVVNSDGTWSVAVGRTVIYAGDRIYAVQSKDGVASHRTYTTVKAKETVDAPAINDVTEGDKYITGTGTAGDTITVYLEDGDAQIGKPVVVDDNGTWKVKVGRTAIYVGDRIYAVQSKDGVESDRAYTTVKAEETVTAPKINDVTEGDATISGTGKAGDTITVYLEDGDTQIGQPVVVDDNGNWSVEVGDANLTAGARVYAVQSKDGVVSDRTYTTVKAKETVDAPAINDVTEGDATISGTGKAGDTITVYLEDGDTQIGQPVVVDDNGNWSVEVGDANLTAGARVYVVQSKDGVNSEPTYTTVKSSVATPFVNPVKAGDTTITGKGVSGDTITCYLKNPDGTTTPIAADVTVDSFGNWRVTVPANLQLQEGDVIEVIQTASDGTQSKPVDVTVTA